ncbi:MAG: hypothetical protein ACFCD0_29530 [Gemmataceae bacterium]
MPIKFRCAYCRQLMSIARRKAGTIIRCPTCSGQVIVPKPEEEPAAAVPRPVPPTPQAPSDNTGDLFEMENFEDHFLEPNVEPAPQPSGPHQSFDVPAPIDSGDVNMASPVTGLSGVFLTPGRLVFVILIVVMLIAISFVLGLLVGTANFSSEPADKVEKEVRRKVPTMTIIFSDRMIPLS